MNWKQLMNKLCSLDLTTAEKKTLKIDWLEHETMPKLMSSLKVSENSMPWSPSAASNWWNATNDPKTWSHWSTSDHTHMSKETWDSYKKVLESQHSLSAYNYTQVFPAKIEQAFMTREKAIALNNGD